MRQQDSEQTLMPQWQIYVTPDAELLLPLERGEHSVLDKAVFSDLTQGEPSGKICLGLLAEELLFFLPGLIRLHKSNQRILVVSLGSDPLLQEAEQDAGSVAALCQMPYCHVTETSRVNLAADTLSGLWQNWAGPVLLSLADAQLFPMLQRSLLGQNGLALPKMRQPIPLLRDNCFHLLSNLSPIISELPGNHAYGTGRHGILLCADIGEDAFRAIDETKLRVLQPLFQYPLPETWLMQHVAQLDTLLVVEGHSSIVLNQLCRFLAQAGHPVVLKTLSPKAHSSKVALVAAVLQYCQEPDALPEITPVMDLAPFLNSW